MTSVTEGPWKTTRLIGRRCKARNRFSLPVLMPEDLTISTIDCMGQDAYHAHCIRIHLSQK